MKKMTLLDLLTLSLILSAISLPPLFCLTVPLIIFANIRHIAFIFHIMNNNGEEMTYHYMHVLGWQGKQLCILILYK